MHAVQQLLTKVGSGTALEPVECVRFRVKIEERDGLIFLESEDVATIFAVVDSRDKVRPVLDRLCQRVARTSGVEVKVLMNCDLSGPMFDVVLLPSNDDGSRDR